MGWAAAGGALCTILLRSSPHVDTAQRAPHVDAPKLQPVLSSTFLSCRYSLSFVQVELLSEGDHVNELFIVASGELTTHRSSTMHNNEVRPGPSKP